METFIKSVGSIVDTKKDEFRRMFPRLSEEMESGKRKISIESICSDQESAEKVTANSKALVNYDPDIVDFLRRCDNNGQAEEIINFMEKRGEITHHHAQNLRKQLKKRGLRSFGTKKKEGHYFERNRP
jgi:hypothetical protein